MDPREFAAAQNREARRVTVRVRQVVARDGAPVTAAEREAMAATLLPVVKRSRVRVRDLGVEFMQTQAENVGESLDPQPIRDYESQALVKVLERVTGVPDDGTTERRRVSVTMADPKTRSDVRKRVTVTEENRNDAVVKKVVGDRAAATVERHVRNAAREAISDAAELAGSEVGWARVLSGTESCTFCAMLASRGPAYNSAEAAGFVTQRSGRYDSREAKAYHDHCDCIVVPVFDGEPWYGQEHYELLEELWIESTRGLSAPDSTKAFAEALKKTNLTKLPDAENDNAAAAVDVVSQQRVVEPKADERRATAARKPKEAAPLDAFAARAAMERERERRFRELGLQPTPAEFEIDASIPAESAQRARGQYLSIPESARDVLRTAGVRIGVAPNTDTLFGRTAADRRSLTADGRALGSTSHYSPSDNAVYLAAQDVGRYASGSANVVAHESGHALDYNVLRLNPVTVAWQSPGEAEARYRPRYVHEDPYLMWAHNEFVYPNADIDDYYRTGSQGFAKSGRQEWVAEGFAAMVEGDDALLERISGGSRGADIFRWTMRRLGML